MAAHQNAGYSKELKRTQRVDQDGRRDRLLRQQRERKALEREAGGAQRRGRNNFMSLIGYGSDDE